MSVNSKKFPLAAIILAGFINFLGALLLVLGLVPELGADFGLEITTKTAETLLYVGGVLLFAATAIVVRTLLLYGKRKTY